MSHGSQQLRIFRRCLRDGETLERACEISTIDPVEARLHLARDAADPPPPDAFLLIGEEQEMVRMARKPPEDTGEVKDKDFAKAAKLYKEDIAPARTKASSAMQEASTAFKAVKKVCRIQPSAMRQAISIFEKEDAERDDYLRSMVGAVNELAGETLLTFGGKDLVDAMEVEAPAPAPKRGKVKLVTVAGKPEPHVGGDDDLAEAADTEPRNLDLGDPSASSVAAMKSGDGFTEATPEELAKQAGRSGASEGDRD